MDHTIVSLLLMFSLAIGFYMSWNIGASDVANAMGTSVGSGALSLRQAVALAAVLEFAGAYFFGSQVTHTMRNSIISPALLAIPPSTLAIGMTSALLSAGLWLQVASYFGWPVSTTHTIVGAITGFSILHSGIHAVQWGTLLQVAVSWLTSPLLGGLLSFLLYLFLKKYIFYAKYPLNQTKKWVPYIAALFLFVVVFVLTLKLKSCFIHPFYFALTTGIVTHIITTQCLKKAHCYSDKQIQCRKEIWENILTELHAAIEHLTEAKELVPSRAFVCTLHKNIEALEQLKTKINNIKKQTEQTQESFVIEGIFSNLQIISAAMMAFAHGANDVANAVGPLTITVNALSPMLKCHIPSNIILLWGSFGIVVGLATWGWRVIYTVGRKITELTPSRGFAVEFGCALTVLLASQLRMPISTTHTLIGSLMGLGLARGANTLNTKVLKEIFVSWCVTIPIGAMLCACIFQIMQVVFH